MPTPYSNVFDSFLGKVNDYSLVGMTDSDMEDIMLRFLKSAIPKFNHCKVDLSNRDDTNMTFNIDLSDTEQEILGCLMTIEWLTPKLLDDTLLKQKMTNKDFQIYSPANQLASLRDTRKELQLEVKRLIKEYTYDGEDLSKLKSTDTEGYEPIGIEAMYENKVQSDYE